MLGKQAEELPKEDEIIQRGPAPNQVGLDGLCDPPDRRKAVSRTKESTRWSAI